MTESVLGWRPTHSESCPDERLSVKHSNVVKIALLERCALLATTRAFHVLLIEVEASVNDQVRSDKDGAVTLPWRWSRT